MSEIEILDRILLQAIELERIAAGDQAEALKALRELERQLSGIVATGNLSGASKRQIDAVIAEAQIAINASYSQAGAAVDVHTLIIHVAEGTQAIISPMTRGAVLLSEARMASLATSVLLQGSPLKDWWAKQAADTAFKFAAQVRQGAMANETIGQIVQRIVGKGNTPGIMETSRRNARVLVHSSVMTAANDARLASFRKASRSIAGVRWQATLDSHTCKQCAALDGQSWDLDGKKLEDTRVEFMAPPAHVSCRCILSPIPKRSELTADFAKIGDRVSSKGPQARGTTFKEFFNRMSAAEQDAQFGQGRAELMRAGKITVRDLVDGRGRELKLSELRRK